ncbi:hypothetical protein CTI12_AA243190 [Artemisia annua]|uniref:Uncharacterized protein n=1 Tax=Artemisia annua TaxID=35608 RepID=A0A2U1NPN9_ARTAN|nr:hypothetical protein CTI12_AA243190 [Artemisia annua]
MQDSNHDDETVSLCDLPNYSFDNNCSTTDSQDSSKGDDSFEFFSEEWLETNKNLNIFPYEHMVFGRKLVLPEQPISRKAQESKKRDHASTNVELNSGRSSREREFAKFMSMNKGRNHSVHETKRTLPTSASVKSRWFYHGFGMARVPTEMDLSAIKSRQKRHLQKSCSIGSGKEEKSGFHETKGLGRLLRELSCDGQTHANSMVKASLVCIPRV